MKKSSKKSPAARALPKVDGKVAQDRSAVLVPLSQIKVTKNPREKLENIEDLAASIKTSGLIQPLVVSKITGGWELVAGARRLAALKLLGLKEAPARIIAPSNALDVIRLVENIQRDALTGWDTCKAVHGLISRFPTQKKLAEAIGKNEGYVSKCIAVVNLKPEVARVQDAPLRELFAMLSTGLVERESAGPMAGGRFVDRAIQLKDGASSGRFSLKINFDPDRTPAETRARIVDTLRKLLERLAPA